MSGENPKQSGEVVPFVQNRKLASARTVLEQQRAAERVRETNETLSNAAQIARADSKEYSALFAEATSYLVRIEPAIKSMIAAAQKDTSENGRRIWIRRRAFGTAETSTFETLDTALGNFFIENSRPRHHAPAAAALRTWLANNYGNAVWLVDKIENPNEVLPDSEKNQPVGMYLVVKEVKK